MHIMKKYYIFNSIIPASIRYHDAGSMFTLMISVYMLINNKLAHMD